MMQTMTVSTLYVRVVATVVLTAAIATAVVVQEINQRVRPREIPTIWFGSDVGEAAEHYAEAIGEGKRSLLNYVSPGARPQWYRYKTECKGQNAKGSGKECDEYPFGKTSQGGPSNYPNGVSLRIIDEDDNALAGTRFSQFLGAGGCNIPANRGPKSAFKVGTTPGPTGWHCGTLKR
jgi:hypothetical protein